jgi:LAS superfamily LD-carboxypeptidase LdcB
MPVVTPALGLLMAIAFVLGGVTAVQLTNTARADRAAVVAAAAEEARLERVWSASKARLTGLVTAEAAHHRTQALDAATEALAAADATLADATLASTSLDTGATQEAKDALVAATARLEALVERAPTPETVLGADTPPGTTSDLPDVTDSALIRLAAPVGAAAPTPVPADTDAITGAGASASTPAAPAATSRAAGAPVTDAAAAPAQPDDAQPLSSVEALEALDADTSDRLLEVAEEVTELVSQLRIAAQEAAAAQLAAAAAAESARVAAEQAAAAELARKVAAADAAPNGDIPADVLCGVAFDSDVLVRCDAAADLERLNAAFRERFGHDISISDSYRDYAGQVLARDTRGDLAATPGTSNHGRGLAIDLDGFGDLGQFDRPYYVWMSAHAADYGWLHPTYMDPGGTGPLEPWHWEYKTQ